MAKIAQNPPQEPPSRPPKTPKCGQNAVVLFDFTLRPFFERSLPRLPKMLKKAPQKASRWPSWPQLGLKMGILAPTWPVLASTWLPLGAILGHMGEILLDPSPAKIVQTRPRQILIEFWCQGRSQDLPDPLQTSISQGFGIHFEQVLVNFRSTFL